MPRPANPQLPRMLLEAAARLLDERGDVDFSIRELAGEAGYAATAVYRCFKDRDALLSALQDRLFTGFSLYLAPPDSGSTHERLGHFGRHFLEWATSHPARYTFMFRPTPRDDGRDGGERASRLGVGTIRALIHQGVARGELAPLDERATAAFFFSTLHGLASLTLSGQLSHPETSNALDLYERHHRHWLEAIAPRRPGYKD